MNSVSALRRRTDLTKLQELQVRYSHGLKIIDVFGDPPQKIKLGIRIPTAKNANYPKEKQEVTEVEIHFPEKYPLEGPTVKFLTPIWNPNVYSSGKWCFGDWKPTENLELFVMRLMKVIALDPLIVNPLSAANSDAARWYVELKKMQPPIFPTISLQDLGVEIEKPKLSWKSIK
jgi:ubiquitin-conjugating enzyme E2 T